MQGYLFSFWDWLDIPVKWLPEFVRLVVWGLALGAISTLLYRKISPQSKLKALADASKTSRSQLARYDGEFDGLMPLIKQFWSLALRHFLLAAASSIPPLFLVLANIHWIESIKAQQPPYRWLDFGPAWAVSWHLPYFIPLVVVSLSLKRRWRLH